MYNVNIDQMQYHNLTGNGPVCRLVVNLDALDACFLTTGHGEDRIIHLHVTSFDAPRDAERVHHTSPEYVSDRHAKRHIQRLCRR